MDSRIAPTGSGGPYPLRGKVRSFLALAALGVVVAACTAPGTVKDLNVKDWVGANERQLLATWGRPHHSYPMVAGGKMIGYQFSDNTVEWIKSHPHTPRAQLHGQLRDRRARHHSRCHGDGNHLHHRRARPDAPEEELMEWAREAPHRGASPD